MTATGVLVLWCRLHARRHRRRAAPSHRRLDSVRRGARVEYGVDFDVAFGWRHLLVLHAIGWSSA